MKYPPTIRAVVRDHLDCACSATQSKSEALIGDLEAREVLVSGLASLRGAIDAIGLESELREIAREELNLETLETRKADGLDFSAQAVWSIKSALERAFYAGVAAGVNAQTECTRNVGKINTDADAWRHAHEGGAP